MAKKSAQKDLTGLLNIETIAQRTIEDQYQFTKCGCYVKNQDLVAKYHQSNQNVSLPLRYIDYNIQIVNNLAKIALIQQYQNPLDVNLQIEYSFPVDESACIYSFKAMFDKRELIGIVKKKDQAKQEYQKGKAQGRQVAYAEIDDEIKQVINLQIGNIPPKTKLKIYIEYLQELDVTMNTFWRLRILSKISPYYLHYKTQTQNEKKSKNKDLIADYTWSFKISIKQNNQITFYKSSSHTLVLISQNKNKKQLTLAMQKSCTPHTDFELCFSIQNFDIPSYILGKTDVSTSAIISFIPKFTDLNADDAFQMFLQKKQFEFNLQKARGQYIFVIDRSGSMGGSRIKQARETLIMLLENLPKDCYFNIYSFGSSHVKMFEDSIKLDKKNINNAIKNIKTFEADMGGNSIPHTIDAIYKTKVIVGYPKQIFLLTDGNDDHELVAELASNNSKYARLNNVGIGRDAVPALIKDCAKKGKGRYVYVDDSEDMIAKVLNFMKQALSPVISDITIEYPQKDIEMILPHPKDMPYIIKNESATLYVLFKEGFQGSAKFKLNYTINQVKFERQVNVKTSSESHHFIDKLVHFKELKLLYNSLKYKELSQTHILIKKITNLKEFIIQQSVKHQILTADTAFVCIGKQLLDNKFQQFITKAKKAIVIPQYASAPYAYTALPARRYGASGTNSIQEVCIVQAENYNCEISQQDNSQYYQQQFEETIQNELINLLLLLQLPNGSWQQESKILQTLKIQLYLWNKLKAKYNLTNVLLTILVVDKLKKLTQSHTISLSVRKAEAYLRINTRKLKVSATIMEQIKRLV